MTTRKVDEVETKCDTCKYSRAGASVDPCATCVHNLAYKSQYEEDETIAKLKRVWGLAKPLTESTKG